MSYHHPEVVRTPDITAESAAVVIKIIFSTLAAFGGIMCANICCCACYRSLTVVRSSVNSSIVSAMMVSIIFVVVLLFICMCIYDCDGFFQDLTRLRADAVVNSTNETLSEPTVDSERLHKAAGPELLTDCEHIGNCRTGDVKYAVERSHNLFLLPC